MAVESADDALGKSNGVGDASSLSRNRSADLLEQAGLRHSRTEKDLTDRLADAKVSTDEVGVLNQRATDDLAAVRRDLASLQNGEVGRKAQELATLAEDAMQKTEEAASNVDNILQKLPDDRRKIGQLVNDVARTRKDMDYGEQQTNDVKTVIPRLRQLIQLTGATARNVETLRSQLMRNVTELKRNIELARDQANRIRVGMEFLGNTTVALRNPPDIDQAGSYSRLTMHIRTTQSNALLAYVGSESIPNRPVPDYMSVELRNGQPVFRFNLGSGPAEITHPWTVNDDKWYRITANRVGKTGTLFVAKEENEVEEEARQEGESNGLHTVLELDPVTTKFLVGGVPSTVMLPSGIARNFYAGVMEDVAFDGRPLGLWNFVYGENNYVGAIERDKLRGVKSNGYSFNGKGYVILNRNEINFIPAVKSRILLQFKTYAENGLILYLGKDRDYLSLEMRDGKILFQYDLGGMPAKIESQRTYNDGQWHRILANRNERDGLLTINSGEPNQETIRGESPGTLTQLAFGNEIFVGGYNELVLPVPGVRSIGFDGCIQDVQFGSTLWDLTDNIEAKEVISGCPERIVRTATFSSRLPGYISLPFDSIGENFDVTFRMRTTSNNSLLMYTADNDQNTVFSVSIAQGKIVVTSDPGGDLTVLETTVNTYNDGKWHYISVMKMGRKLMLNINDERMVNKTARTSVSDVVTERSLYFGGTDFTIPEESVGSASSFTGCISDITVNRRFINLATIPRQNVRAVAFGECGMTRPDQVTPDPGPGEVTTMPMPEGKCALPTANVDLTGAGGTSDGMMYGTDPSSRQEFGQLPAGIITRSEMEIELKTTAPNGVIFYASDTRHRDFLALYMKDGRVGFAFNCGTGTARIVSTQTYNDNSWHKVKFSRNAVQGVMEIDDVKIGDDVSRGPARALNVRSPYYLGGISSDKAEAAKKNVEGLRTGYVGCLKNFMVSNKDVVAGTSFNIQPCIDTLEQGTFFYADGGYVQMNDRYRVGLDLTLSVEIRPRNLTGVILSVHSGPTARDFMMLQMKDGEIIFSADNGAGIITTTYTPDVENALCDGQWHIIKATKAKNTLLLTVDDNPTITAVGTPGSSATDTTEPLFVGGVPDFNRRGMLADGNFVGCIRNLVMNDETQYVTAGTATGSIQKETCPVN